MRLKSCLATTVLPGDGRTEAVKEYRRPFEVHWHGSPPNAPRPMDTQAARTALNASAPRE